MEITLKGFFKKHKKHLFVFFSVLVVTVTLHVLNLLVILSGIISIIIFYAGFKHDRVKFLREYLRNEQYEKALLLKEKEKLERKVLELQYKVEHYKDIVEETKTLPVKVSRVKERRR